MLDISQEVAERVAREVMATQRKLPKVSKTFKGEEHFVSQKVSKLTGKNFEEMFDLMEAKGD